MVIMEETDQDLGHLEMGDLGETALGAGHPIPSSRDVLIIHYWIIVGVLVNGLLIISIIRIKQIISISLQTTGTFRTKHGMKRINMICTIVIIMTLTLCVMRIDRYSSKMSIHWRICVQIIHLPLMGSCRLLVRFIWMKMVCRSRLVI